MPSPTQLGSTILNDLRHLLNSADLVIGVLTREHRPDIVLFELGQARAAKRRILLLVPSGNFIIPSVLEGIPVVRTSLTNGEAMSFALDQLIAAPETTIRASQIDRSRLRGLESTTDSFLHEVNEAISKGQESDIEKIVARAIRESGVDAIAQRPGPHGRGADLAVWSDFLQDTVGNPLLIEIKANIRSKNDARRDLQYFSALVSSSATPWGLFLYGQGPGLEERGFSTPPNVLVLSLASLFERMKDQPFVELVTWLRNQRAHGGSS